MRSVRSQLQSSSTGPTTYCSSRRRRESRQNGRNRLATNRLPAHSITQRLPRPEPAEFCEPALFVEDVLRWLLRLVWRLSVGDGDCNERTDGSVFVGVTNGLLPPLLKSDESVVPE